MTHRDKGPGHGALRALHGLLPLLAYVASGCTTAADIPSQNTTFSVMYGSMTDQSSTSKLEGEKQGKVRLHDIMNYLGIIPVFDESQHPILPQPDALFGTQCDHFLDKDDPDNQAACGRAPGEYMIADYVKVVRFSLPPERLILLVSPFKPFRNEVIGLTETRTPRDVNYEACFLFDDQITSLAGSDDVRWRGLGVAGMHELGHLLGVDDLENDPLDHNAHYAWGCIMRQQLTQYDFERDYRPNGDPLIFCRTDGTHSDQSTTCHGILRASFNLPYGVNH